MTRIRRRCTGTPDDVAGGRRARAGKRVRGTAVGERGAGAPYVRWLLALAYVWQIEADLRRSRWAALAGGLLVVAGAVLFFIAAGGPA